MLPWKNLEGMGQMGNGVRASVYSVETEHNSTYFTIFFAKCCIMLVSVQEQGSFAKKLCEVIVQFMTSKMVPQDFASVIRIS